MQKTYEYFRSQQDIEPWLSEEWQELEWVADTIHPAIGESYAEMFPGLSEYAVESTIHAEMFEHFETGDFNPRRPHRFTQQLTHQIELYMSLGSVHSAENRLDGFTKLAASLARYVDIIENPSNYGLDGESTEYKHLMRSLAWRKRVFASVLEEYGVVTGDSSYLASSLALNQELINDNNIPVTHPYKMHAAFSRFDIAEELRYEDPESARHMGLPVSGRELQAEFYDVLESIASEAIKYTRSNKPTEGEIGQTAGTLIELTVLGYLRDRIEQTETSLIRMARQGFLHEDHMPCFYVDGRKLHVPNMSLDLSVQDRKTPSRLKVEVKKGKSKPEPMMPDIMIIKARYHKTPDLVLIQRIADFAAIRARYWRGQTPTVDESKAVSAIEAKLSEELDSIFPNQVENTRAG